ncbi:hypothetical protein DOY81_013994 [Sarcophaga bullata]|nr:hypothetical protein DOY81_013994 [Sarcophaga bullata]
MAAKAIPRSSRKSQTVNAEFVLPPSDVVIVDCGSSTAKAGFSGENNPRLSVPNVVGRPKKGAAVGIRSEKDSYVGEDAQQKRAVLNLSNPIERGLIHELG